MYTFHMYTFHMYTLLIFTHTHMHACTHTHTLTSLPYLSLLFCSSPSFPNHPPTAFRLHFISMSLLPTHSISLPSLGPLLVELFGKDWEVWPCWARCVTGVEQIQSTTGIWISCRHSAGLPATPLPIMTIMDDLKL